MGNLYKNGDRVVLVEACDGLTVHKDPRRNHGQIVHVLDGLTYEGNYKYLVLFDFDRCDDMHNGNGLYGISLPHLPPRCWWVGTSNIVLSDDYGEEIVPCSGIEPVMDIMKRLISSP